MKESKEKQAEGLFVKLVDSPYDLSGTRKLWMKLKSTMREGIADTIDLVPIGAYYGKGKRSKVLGSFLLATYNPETKKYEPICKIGTGFSEEFLAEATRSLQKI